jgi:hypothetical protein
MPTKEEITQEEFLIKRAVLGLDAEQFKKSSVGRYIFDRIDMEIERLLEELYGCPAEDSGQNREIRNSITIRRLLIGFIDEAIASGLTAERELEVDATPID